MREAGLRPSARRHSLRAIAPRAFKRSLFGYRPTDVDEAIAWRDSAVKEETRRANDAVMRAGELEQASLDLATQVDSLEQVADRLAMRVVEREKEIVTLSARLEAAIDALRMVEVTVDDLEAGPARQTADVFDGLIEVEVGPLSDFEQLASFEDAASGIGGAEGISVKRFAQGRATLEMQLSEPVELLRELEDRAPFEFTVRDTRDDRVVLDVDGK